MPHRILECALIAVLTAGISGCSSASRWGTEKETPAQQVSLSAVPEPARIVIEKSTAGGQIRKIEKEDVDGKEVALKLAAAGQILEEEK